MPHYLSVPGTLPTGPPATLPALVRWTVPSSRDQWEFLKNKGESTDSLPDLTASPGSVCCPLSAALQQEAQKSQTLTAAHGSPPPLLQEALLSCPQTCHSLCPPPPHRGVSSGQPPASWSSSGTRLLCHPSPMPRLGPRASSLPPHSPVVSSSTAPPSPLPPPPHVYGRVMPSPLLGSRCGV